MVDIHCDGLRNLANIMRSSGQPEKAGAYLALLSQCDEMKSGFESELKAVIPPLWIRGLNFATAMARWAAAGMPRRTQAEIDERLAICQSCPELVDNHCGKCGCACVETNQVMNKLALSTEACPLGKWK